MAKKREKKVIVSGVSREQMEEAFGKYAEADANIERITATMDAQFTTIRQGYAEELTGHENTKKKAFEIIQAYATENREDLFTKKKSIETAHGILGFRTSTPKLKTRKGFTWSAVLQLLKKEAPEYIRTSEEVAKDELLADRKKERAADIFESVGVFVDQDETFYVECKKEEAVSV